MIACAITGLGRWGRSLVEAANTTTRLKITRAVETDLVRAQPFCAQHNIALTGDFDSVLAHVFLPGERSYYDLDSLWGTAQKRRRKAS